MTKITASLVQLKKKLLDSVFSEEPKGICLKNKKEESKLINSVKSEMKDKEVTVSGHGYDKIVTQLKQLEEAYLIT